MAWTTFRIHGLACLKSQGLRLEWSGSGALDAVRGMDVKTQLVSLPIEHLIVPLPRMRSIQLAGGWLRPRVEITANDLAVLRAVPGEHNGRVALWLARRDRRLASTLIRAIHEAAKELRLSSVSEG
jgi:hypothetical protein